VRHVWRTFALDLGAAALAYLVLLPPLILMLSSAGMPALIIGVVLVPTILGVFGILAVARQLRWHNTQIAALRQDARDEWKWRRHATQQLNAVLRQQWLNRHDDVPYPQRLSLRRFHLYAQNEEDGILLALLDAAGTRSHAFVEIGCGRSGGNAAVLAYELGWRGLMVDASAVAVDEVRRRLAFNPSVRVVQSAVTPQNVDDLLREHGVDGEVDVFSIDIDSYDYWLLAAMSASNPRILIVEYNAHFGAELSVTVPLNGRSNHKRVKSYYGASLAAMEKLARSRGYRLVVCDNSGTNAFFLRGDVAPEIPGITPADAYRAPANRRDQFGTGLLTARLSDGSASPDLPLVEV